MKHVETYILTSTDSTLRAGSGAGTAPARVANYLLKLSHLFSFKPNSYNSLYEQSIKRFFSHSEDRHSDRYEYKIIPQIIPHFAMQGNKKNSTLNILIPMADTEKGKERLPLLTC